MRRFILICIVFGTALLHAGCAALLPVDRPLGQRLADFGGGAAPIEAPVYVRWEKHGIPYVIASRDGDAAFVLGMIQAHLRGGQLALARHLVRGRLSELGGPALWDTDHALRILDFGRGAEAALASMPPSSRAWMESFVAGINYFEQTHGLTFPEARLLGLSVEPYTAADMIAIGRLGGMDVNWPTYRDLAAHWGKPEFERVFDRVAAAGSDTPTARRAVEEGLGELLEPFSAQGSNAWVVSPRRSRSGGALLAADPHLSTSQPPIWIAVGVRAPSLKAVGLMPLGVPVIAIGRSPVVAWAGTNLHAATSDLYDVSGLPAEAILTNVVRIKTRLLPDTEREVRMSPVGPIVSDAAMLQIDDLQIALRWAGHLPSDEITAMLHLAIAESPGAVHSALASFGQPPQMFVFGNRRGQIGSAIATLQPDRAAFAANEFVKNAGTPDPAWERMLTARDFAVVVDPPAGLIVSANQKPAEQGRALSFTFAGRERAQRIEELLMQRPKLSLQDLADIQRDTLSRPAAQLAHALAGEIRFLSLDDIAPDVVTALEDWDGSYAADSTKAPVFECLLYELLPALHGKTRVEDLDPLDTSWEAIVAYLLSDLHAFDLDDRRALVRAAVLKADRDTRDRPEWGDIHQISVAHTLSAIPVIGGLFKYGSVRAGGSRQTPLKAAHGLMNAQTTTDFGASARFLADMSSPDENYLVLFGGEDGWLASENQLDQIPLWLSGAYIRMPLSQAGIAAAFPTVTVWTPLPGTPQTPR